MCVLADFKRLIWLEIFNIRISYAEAFMAIKNMQSNSMLIEGEGNTADAFLTLTLTFSAVLQAFYCDIPNNSITYK